MIIPKKMFDEMKNMIELGNEFLWDPYNLRVYKEIPPQTVSSFEM